MRRAGSVALVLMFVLAGLGFAADDGDAILGVWLTSPKDEGGQAHVTIGKEDGEYVGRITWLEEPVYPPNDDKGMAGQSKVDRENPDPALRNRPTMGLQIVWGFTYAGNDEWTGGHVYDPNNGKTYKAKMRLVDNGKVLKLRGFVGISMFGRTSEWTRVEGESGETPETAPPPEATPSP